LPPARELAELFVERIAEMLHTKNGAMCAWLVTCIATAKQRKQLVRSVKQYAKRVFTDEWGHKVAVRLLTCVDDTVLLRKMLVSEIVTSLDELLLHRNGRRVILSMLRSPPAPRRGRRRRPRRCGERRWRRVGV
jgi:pumilio family protein 6